MRGYSTFAAALAAALFAVHPANAQVQGQWTSVGAMQTPRDFSAQARLANGQPLAIGGVDATGAILASAEAFNPATNNWTLTGSMASAREGFSAVTLPNGRVLAIGGWGFGGVVLGSAEIYDPATGVWSAAGSLSVARYNHSATLLADGKVLVAGGCTSSGSCAPTAVSEIYDATTNAWSTTGALNLARSDQNAVRLNDGRVLVVGGLASVGASTEIYNPATGAWSVAANTNVSRYLSQSNLLPSGKVLVTGGAVTSSAELYDPLANRWTLTGSMATFHFAHSATPLANGDVLIAGGYGQSISCGKDCTGYIPVGRSEIYNEAAGVFSATGNLPRALANQTLTLLTSGRALTNGGYAYGIGAVANAQMYTPLTLALTATSLNFGLQQIGGTSAPQTVSVTNVSANAVAIAKIVASGDYAQINTCPATLNPSQQCTITVDFAPTAAGVRNGAVTLTDNSSGSPKQTIALTGTGEPLALGFNVAKINFGGVSVGSSGAGIATLINDGGAPVAISGISVAPVNHTFTQTNNCPPTLAVQQSCTIQISFAPPDVFNYKATLSVSNSAGAAPALSLIGQGLDGP